MGNVALCGPGSAPTHVVKGNDARDAIEMHSQTELPPKEGWLEKLNRRGRWQQRYFKLRGKQLFYHRQAEAPDPIGRLDLSQVSDIRQTKLADTSDAAHFNDTTDFYIVFTDDSLYLLRAPDAVSRTQWVEALRVRLSAPTKRPSPLLPSLWPEKAGLVATTSPRALLQLPGEDGSRRAFTVPMQLAIQADSEEMAALDSDDDGPERKVAEKPPKWFRKYDQWTREKEQLEQWTMLTMTWMDSLLQHEGEESKHENGQPSRVADLAAKMDPVYEAFMDRIIECKKRFRADMIRHLVHMLDLRMLQEVAPYTTGRIAESYSPLELIALTKVIEAAMKFHDAALGSLQLTGLESRPGIVLRELRRDLIDGYSRVVGPKLRQITDRVLHRLLSEQTKIIRQGPERKIGTDCPADLFSLLTEHLSIGKTSNSTVLERKLLSSVMVELLFYQTSILSSLLDTHLSTTQGLDIDFLTACINDCDTLIEYVDRVETQFGSLVDRIAKLANKHEDQMSLSFENDNFGVDEMAEVQEDLDAIRSDIPRTRAELSKCALQLTGLLVDVILGELKPYTSTLFTKQWESPDFRSQWANLLSRHVRDVSIILRQQHVVQFVRWLTTGFVLRYMLHLINPARLVIVGEKSATKVKVDDAKAASIMSDDLCLRSCVRPYIPQEDVSLILQILQRTREFLTNDEDILVPMFEAAMIPGVFVHAFLVFEKCLDMRHDLSNSDRKRLLNEAVRIVRQYREGERDADTGDDTLDAAFGLCAGMGVSGWSMAQTADLWAPQHTTHTLFRCIFEEDAVAARTADLDSR